MHKIFLTSRIAYTGVGGMWLSFVVVCLAFIGLLVMFTDRRYIFKLINRKTYSLRQNKSRRLPLKMRRSHYGNVVIHTSRRLRDQSVETWEDK